MLVKVTQEHIDLANRIHEAKSQIPKDLPYMTLAKLPPVAKCCPVALAIQEATNLIDVRVGHCAAFRPEKGLEPIVRWWFPAWVSERISRWDMDGQMRPFEFETE